jgi:hypothetical protein
MQTYLVDIVVHDVQLYEACNSIRNPMWITLKADGLSQTFTTSPLPPSPRIVWNCPVRLVLNLASLDDKHFKTTIHTTGYLGEDLAVACAQVRLNSLVFGQPKKFCFPLLNVRDFRVTAAMLTVTAAISVLPQQARQTPSLPGYQQPHRPLPPGPRTVGGGYPHNGRR